MNFNIVARYIKRYGDRLEIVLYNVKIKQTYKDISINVNIYLSQLTHKIRNKTYLLTTLILLADNIKRLHNQKK